MIKKVNFFYILMAVMMAFGMLGMQPAQPVQAVATELFFSEYIEGSSNNKAVEIFNGTGSPVNLADYEVRVYSNGSGTPTSTIPLSGTLASNDVFVIAHTSANAAILALADLTSGSLSHNGDDAITLRNNALGTTVDVIGQTGSDPGDRWGTEPITTVNHTLVRKCAISTGDNVGMDAFYPEVEWDSYAVDTVSYLGSHTTCWEPPVYPERFIISEYIEGSGNNKAIELYNGTGEDIDLQNFKLVLSTNGSADPGNTLSWAEETILADGETYVIANSGAVAGILALADITHTVTYYNGDDALVLYEVTEAGDIVQDSFGQLGFDPGTSWGSGDTATAEHTLVRKANVCSGDLILGDVFEPSLEWNGFAQDTFSDLGSHTMTCGPAVDVPPVVSSTVPADNALNVGPGSGITITFSEPVTVTGDWYTLSCSASGTHTAVVDASANPIFTLNPDTDFTANEVCTVTVVAANVSDQDEPVDAMAANYVFDFTIAEGCGGDFTPIYSIQGSEIESPVIWQTITTEGVVVGDFQTGGKKGFYIQDPVGDGDTATSDGIFIYYFTAPDVEVGDEVRVTGVVSEYYGLTEITGSAMQICSTDNEITPTEITLPVESVSDFEKYEGMLVTFPQSLYISEYFNYDQYGEIVLTSQRHMTPTAIVEPGAPAQAAAAAYLLDRITLDDGRTLQNPHPALHPNGAEFTLANLFRGGGTLTNVTGVMDYMSNLYRIQPTQGAIYADVNPRTDAPDVAEGDLMVASFNVLNFFVTLDGSGDRCGPAANANCRGADNAAEFTRQRDKILSALHAIDADVYGLMEIENDRPGGDDPVANLVDGLNAIPGSDTYAYIDTDSVGTDAIKQAILYKPGSVTPVGDYQVLDSSVDARFIDTANRPVLAQVFEDNISGEQFVVAVNHLKSKGSACDGDGDTGDGQGNCNQTRVAAAQAMVDWLADPEVFGDVEKFLIIGDLNSYDKEDPIDSIKRGADDTAGTDDDFLDMIYEKQGDSAYGYVFDGQTGYLDHALANQALAAFIVDANLWHINADEPDIIDYDNSYKSPEQAALLYAPDAYRSSDHDPVIVTLTFEEVPEFFITQDFGPWGSNWPGAINLGWKYIDTFDIETIASIEVGMLDADENIIVKYTADAEQVAWQKANSYITPGGQESAPFYQWYNGDLITEGRDDDWTVVFGPSFAGWNPAWGFVKVTDLDGNVDYKTVAYTAAPVYADDIFEITDFGLWGQVWPGALSLGWGYSEPFDTDTIASIEVGMVDADRNVIVRYTADAEQVAWQKDNGYITAAKLSSAPFYQEYQGMPIVEGRDLNWTVIMGPSFENWDPAWAYVRVITTTGAVDYDVILYTGATPGEAPVISSTDLEGPYNTGAQQEFHVTLDNSTLGYAYSNVLAVFELDGVTLADIDSFEYLESQDGLWHDLPISETAAGIMGAFGPASGFPIGVPYNATSSFRITFNTSGTFSATITLYDVAADPDRILDVFSAEVEVNGTPVAQAQSVTTDEDTAKDVVLAAMDIDGDTLTYTVVTQPAHGALSGTVPNLTYTPNANYNGTDSFTFKANDGTVDSNIATVTITVTAVNDAPVAGDQSVTTDEDTAKAITLAATDIDGDTLTYAVVAGPSHGTLSGTAPNLTYTPSLDWSGTDSFTYKANDGTADSNTATVTITVSPLNDAPLAISQDVDAIAGETLEITLEAVDVDGDALTFSIVEQPLHGTLEINGNLVLYTPDADYDGLDSFTFKANDGTLDSDAATISIAVTRTTFLHYLPMIFR